MLERDPVPEWAQSKQKRRKSRPVKGYKSLLSRVKSFGPAKRTLIRAEWPNWTLVIFIEDQNLIAETRPFNGKASHRTGLNDEQLEDLLTIVDPDLANRILFAEDDEDDDDY